LQAMFDEVAGGGISTGHGGNLVAKDDAPVTA
jgi:hypothetical protein